MAAYGVSPVSVLVLIFSFEIIPKQKITLL
jgi:hypothetical protein